LLEKAASKGSLKRQPQTTASKDSLKRQPQKTASKGSLKRQPQKTASKDSLKRQPRLTCGFSRLEQTFVTPSNCSVRTKAVRTVDVQTLFAFLFWSHFYIFNVVLFVNVFTRNTCKKATTVPFLAHPVDILCENAFGKTFCKVLWHSSSFLALIL